MAAVTRLCRGSSGSANRLLIWSTTAHVTSRSRLFSSEERLSAVVSKRLLWGGGRKMKGGTKTIRSIDQSIN